jgi:cytochrome c oxidase subunit 3
MWVFLASLTVLFLASIAGYLVVRLKADAWPPPGMPRLPGGLIVATVVLLTCSLAVHLALASARRGQTTAMTRWLQATFALGTLFLVLQTVTWWRLVTLNVTAGSNLYAFTFYMLTGLHGAHVVGGLAQLVFVIAKALRGRYGSGYHPGVLYAAMYWHFLDAVWVVLFLVMFVFA